MKYPIICNGDEVKAFLEGRKTQIRRVIKKIPSLIYSIQDDRIMIVYNKEKRNDSENFEWNPIGENPNIPEQRLYGWGGREYLFTYQVQRLWKKGIRGLVSACWAQEQQGLSYSESLPPKQKGDKISAQTDLYVFSRNATIKKFAGEAFGREQSKQHSRKLGLGNSSGELAGSPNSWDCNNWGETLGLKAHKRREKKFMLGNSKRIVFSACGSEGSKYEPIGYLEYCKFQIGMNLWVRETFGIGTRPDPFEGWIDGIEYKADEAYLQDDLEDLPIYKIPDGVEWDKYEGGGWKSPIYMPRWASRLTLEVTNVRVERVQDINEAGAIKEGILRPNPYTLFSEIILFADLWDSINAKKGYGWDVNPWVWVIDLKRIDG